MNNTLSNLQSIEAQRADFAFEKILSLENKMSFDKESDLIKNVKENTGNYASHAKDFPLLIRNNSLLAALLFAQDKGDKDYSWKLLLNHCIEWLNHDNCPFKYSIPKQAQIENYNFSGLSNLPTDQLIHITNEVLKLMEWIRRYAPESKNKNNINQGNDVRNGMSEK